MSEGKFVSYIRVSTAKQGRSGLGLEAQRHAVETYLNGGNWKLVKEFIEVESGKKADRPQLAKAFQACRVFGAKLVIAKLDRLSRNAHFLLGLENAGVDFVAADMPHANRLTVGIMAMVAEDEGRRISERTKAALAAAKRRGVKLGGDHGAQLTAKQRAAGVAARQAKAQACSTRHCRGTRRPRHSDCTRWELVRNASSTAAGAHRPFRGRRGRKRRRVR